MAGNLTVTIVEAKNLRDEDTVGGANDAFVEVWLDDDYKQRTKTIPNSTNPQWNETFNFRLEKKQEHVYIKVHDEDGPIDRDTIGSAKIDLDPVRNAGQSEQWVKLPRLFGLSSNGEVLIRMSYTA